MDVGRYDIRSYSFDPTVSYFVDTNVWFLAFGPTPLGGHRVHIYKPAVQRLRSSGAKTFIDALVLSELVNAWARTEFRRAGATDFKAFRNSTAFKVIAQGIVDALRKIFAFALPTATAFANIDLASLLTTFEAGGADINDLLIAETCRSKSFVLVTDDADMKASDVAIVTANPLLLAR